MRACPAVPESPLLHPTSCFARQISRSGAAMLSWTQARAPSGIVRNYVRLARLAEDEGRGTEEDIQ